MRLGQHDAPALVVAFGNQGLGFQARELNPQALGQPVDQHEADGVAVVAEFRAGVAQPDDQVGSSVIHNSRIASK